MNSDSIKQTAIAALEDIKARDKLSPLNPGAQVRAGVHAGDVIDQPDGDLLGHGVNIAARLQGEAEPNGVLVSLAAVNLVRDSVGAQFSRRGPLALRNIEEPVVAFDAVFRTDAARSGCRVRFEKWRLAMVAFAIASFAALISQSAALRQKSPTAAVSSGTRAANATVSDLGAPLEGQEIAEIADAMRSFKSPVRSPSETVWLQGILRELRRSGEQINQEVFAHLANNNLRAAVAMLKDDYDRKRSTLSDAEMVSYLLTLGALTFDYAPGDSVAYHRSVLDIAPDHFLAHVRLGELYYTQAEYARADSSFREALRIGSPKRDEELYAEIKHAAAQTIEEKYESAAIILEAAAKEAEEMGWNSLVILARNRLAYVRLKEGNHEAARDSLALVTAFSNAHQYPEELAFAYSALGRMALERKNFAEAKTHFDSALSLELEIGRPAGLADTYFYIGVIEAETGYADRAQQTFQTALDISRGARSFGYNNLKNMEIKNQIGKAFAFKVQGLHERACEEMRVAAAFDANRDIIYNPQTKLLIQRIGCPFGPLDFMIAQN